MDRFFGSDIAVLGFILALCGLVCLILAVTRRAQSPRIALYSGVFLLLFGGVIWLLPLLDIPQPLLTRLSFFFIGIAFVSIDLVNFYKRLKCTVPWQGQFLDVSTYGMRKSGLCYGSAVFLYQVDDVSYQRASLDKRTWFAFLKSPFLKKFAAGNQYPIYLNPNNPRHFALSRRPRFGLFFICGAALLVGFLFS